LEVRFLKKSLSGSHLQRKSANRPFYQNVLDAALVTNGPHLPFKLTCDAAARPAEAAVHAVCSILRY
jgi:hypothetical protein